jgi:hypothetical protein
MCVLASIVIVSKSLHNDASTAHAQLQADGHWYFGAHAAA